MAITTSVGIKVQLDGELFVYSERIDARLFGELPGRVIVSVASNRKSEVREICRERGLEICDIGHIDASQRLAITLGEREFDWMISELKTAYEGSIPAAMAR
jgi:selenophosphate synthetase-related protein